MENLEDVETMHVVSLPFFLSIDFVLAVVYSGKMS